MSTQIAAPDPTAAPPADPPEQERRPSRGRRRALVLLLQVALVAGFIAGWQLLSDADILDPFFFSRPSDIGSRVSEWLSDGTIWGHLGITLAEAAYAFVIGVLSGVIAGFVLARITLLGDVANPFISMANALPRIIFAPIFILWFGLGMTSKIALGVTLVFFIIFYNTFNGVREVDRKVVDNVRMLGASRWQLIRWVYLPSTMTWIFSGLHTSVGFAISGAVVGEYIGSSKGIGYLVSTAEGTLDTTGVFAGIVVLTAVVAVVTAGVRRVERYLFRWKPEFR